MACKSAGSTSEISGNFHLLLFLALSGCKIASGDFIPTPARRAVLLLLPPPSEGRGRDGWLRQRIKTRGKRLMLRTRMDVK